MWLYIAIAIVVGITLTVLSQMGYLKLGNLRRDLASPDHVQLTSQRAPGVLTYTVTYHLPLNYQRFTMVYDPAVVQFDAWETEIQYRAYQSPRGIVRQTTKGQPLAGQPNRMELELANNYTERLRDSDRRYILAVRVRFFALNRDNDAAFRQAFNGIRNAEFRRYLPNNLTFQVIRRDPASPGWTQPGF